MKKPIIHYLPPFGKRLILCSKLNDNVKGSIFQANVTCPKCLELIKQMNQSNQ